MTSKDDLKEMVSKDDLKDMKEDLMKELTSFLSLNSQEEDKENKRIDGQSNMENIVKHLENKRIETQFNIESIVTQLENERIESPTPNHSLLQDSHHHGFNLGPRNYFIPKIDMRKFNVNDPMTWIF